VEHFLCKASSPWYLGDTQTGISSDDISLEVVVEILAAMDPEKRAAPYADEVLPNYSAQDGQPKPPKWRWWWRKRVWMPSGFLIVLLLFGIIFGAAYGVKKSKSE
jgi:hypothetical protein